MYFNFVAIEKNLALGVLFFSFFFNNNQKFGIKIYEVRRHGRGDDDDAYVKHYLCGGRINLIKKYLKKLNIYISSARDGWCHNCILYLLENVQTFG